MGEKVEPVVVGDKTLYRGMHVTGFSQPRLGPGLLRQAEGRREGLLRQVSRLAAIFGCSGPRLTPEEAAFFRDAQPWGFILFKRNIDTPEQVRALSMTCASTIGAADAPVLIDQEGGRVQRLGPPHWTRNIRRVAPTATWAIR